MPTHFKTRTFLSPVAHRLGGIGRVDQQDSAGHQPGGSQFEDASGGCRPDAIIVGGDDQMPSLFHSGTPNKRVCSRTRKSSAVRIHLVPKLRLGTHVLETLFRVVAPMRNGVSRGDVPKRSLGTRKNGVWERGIRLHLRNESQAASRLSSMGLEAGMCFQFRRMVHTSRIMLPMVCNPVVLLASS